MKHSSLADAVANFLEGLDNPESDEVVELREALAAYHEVANPPDNVLPPAPISKLEPTQVEQVVGALENFTRAIIDFAEMRISTHSVGKITAINEINKTRAAFSNALGGMLDKPISHATKTWVKGKK